MRPTPGVALRHGTHSQIPPKATHWARTAPASTRPLAESQAVRAQRRRRRIHPAKCGTARWPLQEVDVVTATTASDRLRKLEAASADFDAALEAFNEKHEELRSAIRDVVEHDALGYSLAQEVTGLPMTQLVSLVHEHDVRFSDD